MKQIPLLYTQQARHRILVAISWDERSDKAKALQRLTGAHTQHDLDLSCFVYDQDGHYIDYVGSMAQDAVDQTGAIYHSGDDATGEGLGDDESISVELAGLPETTKTIFFVTEIRSAHTFGEVADPRMRLADGMSDEDLATLSMAAPENAGKAACVMAVIQRDHTSSTGWTLGIINEYPDLANVSDWGSYLTRYL